MFKINWCKIFGHKTYTTERLKKRHNGREKEIEIIIAETRKIEEAFNKLYQILINGNYKFN